MSDNKDPVHQLLWASFASGFDAGFRVVRDNLKDLISEEDLSKTLKIKYP